ncbi:MAG: hypothetical protein MUF80_00085 [Burkholderiales bacterium]|nr:hypothetical protein [Burkholderiales bacterium]
MHAHIRGDEKGEAHIFLDRLFRAFGWAGLPEAGARCEFRVRNDKGGTSFADLVWKPIVLVEMKRRGVDLARHYRQAFDYWFRLVPGRPRYVVLCDFDEFWIYDFETQIDAPLDVVRVDDLSQRFGPLAFLFPKPETPIFGKDQEKVTRQAADKLATCFNALLKRGVERDLAQRFTLQTLMAFFAEDIGLLERYTFTRLLDECKEPSDSYDLIGGLFDAMNTPGGVTGGRFKGVAYFNGGLFNTPARLELAGEELSLLREAVNFDWSQVRPEIFGVLFEHSLEAEERRAFGAHYTSPVDIMKIVGPTIVQPWREVIESATTLTRLKQLLVRLEALTVLDPACGSGNFIYIAYREIKRLEARIYERMAEEYKSVNPAQRPLGFVTASNFFGMDINPFAIEIAKVTMMLAHKLAIDELHTNENALPLGNLDRNFLAGDALIQADGSRTPWPTADVIIGNPPFLGAKFLKPERGVDYVNAVRRAYPEVPGMADYCVYWFRRAHDALAPCTSDDPFAGRAGLVGTQNIRNNQSRVGGLDYIVETGTIVEAVENQPWSGEANVHVSIVDWINTQDPKVAPGARRLWFKVDPTPGIPRRRRGTGPAAKEYDLDCRETSHINSALSDATDVSKAARLQCNMTPQRCFNGQMLGHAGFLLTKADRDLITAGDPKSATVIHPYLNGVDALTDFALDRFVLDFEQRDQLQAAAFPGAFSWVKARVLPDRERKATEGKTKDGKVRPHHKAFLSRWWQLSFGRPEMLSVIKPLPRYLACAYVTKRPIFIFVASRVRPSNLIQVFGFADDYSFGILQSAAHWQWFVTKCGKLTERFRYSAESVFDTFPWPQAPTSAQIEAVASAGREIREIREKAVAEMKGGLRALYRTVDNPGQNPLKDAHAVLDAAVLAAYGFSAKRDLLAQLLDLNMRVADAIDRGQRVVPPGIPPAYADQSKLITDDCLGAV